jgi:N-formylglutamate amidohydrolase
VGAFLRQRGYDVAINDPYKGMELIRANGNPATDRHSMQIEVNRRLYMNEISRLPHDGFQALQNTFTLLAQHIAGSLPTISRSGP